MGQPGILNKKSYDWERESAYASPQEELEFLPQQVLWRTNKTKHAEECRTRIAVRP